MAAKNNPFGEALRAHRKRRNWSQAELAEHSGMSHTSISHLEIGGRQPTYPTIQALCSALGVEAIEARENLPSDVGRLYSTLPDADKGTVCALIKKLTK